MPQKKELKAKSDAVEMAKKTITKKAENIDKKMTKKEKEATASKNAENKMSKKLKILLIQKK